MKYPNIPNIHKSFHVFGYPIESRIGHKLEQIFAVQKDIE